MDYTQHNKVPTPETGASEAVSVTMNSVFDWQYALSNQKLMNLYEKGKHLNWNANELDWSVNVDLEEMTVKGNFLDFMNHVLKPPRKLTLEEAIQFRTHSDAFTLSQFLHGEQGALLAAAKVVQTVPDAVAKFYASSQVMDEARHVEVYHRYLTEKLGVSYGIHPGLQSLLSDVISDSRWDVTYLGMQILVEGLALAAFGMMKILMPNEPLLQDITTRIMADEARHVGFGVLALDKIYQGELNAAEMKEREDFVIDGIHLMHDRLLQRPVFERLGWDVEAWLEWSRHTPMQQGFRKMMFSKIVPNLRRLGLLTPRIRETLGQLDLLRFENDKDSVEEPGIQPSKELMALFATQLVPASGKAAG